MKYGLVPAWFDLKFRIVNFTKHVVYNRDGNTVFKLK